MLDKLCTGDASDWEKFEAWSRTVPATLRNPLYHWTHLELKKPFGIDELLSEQTAPAIFDRCNELLRQPEFSEASRLHDVLEVLEETRYLATMLQELVGNSDLQIVIGSENQTSQLRSCTVVLTTYGPTRRIRGVLGVVGPTRMDYGQVVGRLRTVARWASERMAEAYA